MTRRRRARPLVATMAALLERYSLARSFALRSSFEECDRRWCIRRERHTSISSTVSVETTISCLTPYFYHTLLTHAGQRTHVTVHERLTQISRTARITRTSAIFRSRRYDPTRRTTRRSPSSARCSAPITSPLTLATRCAREVGILLRFKSTSSSP